jgi:hypothetical protein
MKYGHSIPRETSNYKNGERCIIENCPYKDVTFHHTDYKRDLGFYVCWFHHTVLHHIEKVLIVNMTEMMKERNMSKALIVNLNGYDITFSRAHNPKEKTGLYLDFVWKRYKKRKG